MRPDFESITGQFPREVPVFPLPETVLFPGSLLPLHVFEPRYRQLVDDLRDGDGLLAIGLLDRCDPSEYEQAPPFLPTVCIGTNVALNARKVKKKWSLPRRSSSIRPKNFGNQ